jgi:predicted ester cyclase
MTTEVDNTKIVRRMNDEVWGEGTLDLIDEYVAADYVEHNTASPEEIRGPEGYKENVEVFHDTFSDVEVTTQHLIAEGEKVVNHYTITGTHDGPFMGIEPPGE